MNDRPVTSLIAGIAIAVFIAAFCAAAVLRGDDATPIEAIAKTTRLATVNDGGDSAAAEAPSLSRVAALPALRVKAKPKRKKVVKRARRVAPAPRVAQPRPPVRIAVTPTPRVATVRRVAPARPVVPVVRRPVAPARPVTPARPTTPTRPATPNVGQVFDSSG